MHVNIVKNSNYNMRFFLWRVYKEFNLLQCLPLSFIINTLVLKTNGLQLSSRVSVIYIY